MIGNSGNLRPFRGPVRFLGVLGGDTGCIIGSAAAAEDSGTPTGEVAKGCSWGLRWDGGGDVNPLLASGCDCFIGLRYNNGAAAADDRSTTSVPSSLSISERYSWSRSFWHCVSDFGSANQNASSSSPFERLRLRFLRDRWDWASSLSLLESTEPWFPKSSLSESQSPREHPLLHLLYVLGGVGSEAVEAERFRTLGLARETFPGDISISDSQFWEQFQIRKK